MCFERLSNFGYVVPDIRDLTAMMGFKVEKGMPCFAKKVNSSGDDLAMAGRQKSMDSMGWWVGGLNECSS